MLARAEEARDAVGGGTPNQLVRIEGYGFITGEQLHALRCLDSEEAELAKVEDTLAWLDTAVEAPSDVAPFSDVARFTKVRCCTEFDTG